MDELFYGNLSNTNKNIMKNISKKYSEVAEYFMDSYYNFPSGNETYSEVNSLIKRMNSTLNEETIKLYESQDKNLWNYLRSMSNNMGITDKEYDNIEKFIVENIAPLIVSIKDYWNRARPYQYAYEFDLNLTPYTTYSGHSASYPSGHTLETEVWGYMASKIKPNKLSQINKVVNDVNEGRMNLGIHFPSDIEFSKEIFDYLKNNKLLM